MRKIIGRKWIIVFAIICMLCFCIPAYAKSEDVTGKYKNKFEKILRRFDTSFQAGEGKWKFKFNNYTRTTMLFMGRNGIVGEKYTKAKRKIKREWKKYFDSRFSPRLKSSSSYQSGIKNYMKQKNWAYIIQNIGGKVCYLGGNADEYRVGRVREVIQKNKKTYTVTYDLHTRSIPEGTDYGIGSTYIVTFKKQGKKFRISNIMRT